jgi:DNA polymerase sigma
MSPTAEEHERREELVERIREVTSHLWPSSDLRAFGSFATRLYLPIRCARVFVLHLCC